MAQVFDKIIEYLNKPIPGTAPKKVKEIDAKPKEPVKAIDVQKQMLKRDRDLRRAEKKADEKARMKVIKARRELRELRRQYEAEVAKQAEAHAKTEEWTYTVVPGDTLGGIAKKFYGNASRWPEIQKANKAIIKNPNLIYPGQTFVIPGADDD